MSDDLRRLVEAPDGSRYEIVAAPKDWELGTGSVLLDAAAFLWAAVRQARGKEWRVEVRRVGSKTDTVVTRAARNREEASKIIAELADEIDSGQHTPGVL